MVAEKFRFCVLKDNKELIEFEKKIYQNNILELKNVLNHSFEDVLIIALKDDENIIMFSVINLNMDLKSQFEKLGFIVDIKIPKYQYCETIKFFTTNFLDKSEYIKAAGFLFENINNLLKEKGKRIMFSTCSEEMLNLYLLLGFLNVAEIVNNNKKYHLIKYEL